MVLYAVRGVNTGKYVMQDMEGEYIEGDFSTAMLCGSQDEAQSLMNSVVQNVKYMISEGNTPYKQGELEIVSFQLGQMLRVPSIDINKAWRLTTGLTCSWALGENQRRHLPLEELYEKTLIQIEHLLDSYEASAMRTPSLQEFTEIIAVDRWLRWGECDPATDATKYPRVSEAGNHLLVLDITNWVVNVDILILCVLACLDDIGSYCVLKGGLNLSAALRTEIQASIANVHVATVSFS